MSRSTLEARVRALEGSKSGVAHVLYVVLRSLWRAARLVIDADARSLFLVQRLRARHVHQLSPLTRSDRYPDLFEACRSYFESSESLRILSFGCSTGEEVFSLRTYFPDAYILGVDVNARSIAAGNARNEDPGIEFRKTTGHDLAGLAPFDAIFCLAVLQDSRTRRPGVENSGSIYPFSKFDAQLTALDACLRPGGVFVVDLSTYRFIDSAIAPKYRPSEGSGAWKRLAQFDRNSEPIGRPSYNDRIFVKQR